MRSLYALPIYWLLISIGPNVIPETRSLVQTSLIRAIFCFLIWTMWPLAMWHPSQLVNKRGLFLRYLTAYNWSMVIQAAIWLVSFAVILSFGLTESAAGMVTVLAICVVVLYRIHILRTALELGVLPEAALAGFQLILYQILLGTHHTALLQPV
ncbi:MAG: hypothetical protein ACJ0UT_05490 [Candidatus Latescibacterota bacterium]